MTAPNLVGATVDTPETAPVSDSRLLLTGGLSLTRWVLIILSLTLGVSLTGSILSERRYDTVLDGWTTKYYAATGDSTLAQSRLAALQHIETQVAASRENSFKLLQLVVLNVLLPVLTALLGYVFGSRQGDGRDPS